MSHQWETLSAGCPAVATRWHRVSELEEASPCSQGSASPFLALSPGKGSWHALGMRPLLGASMQCLIPSWGHPPTWGSLPFPFCRWQRRGWEWWNDLPRVTQRVARSLVSEPESFAPCCEVKVFTFNLGGGVLVFFNILRLSSMLIELLLGLKLEHMTVKASGQ